MSKKKKKKAAPAKKAVKKAKKPARKGGSKRQSAKAYAAPARRTSAATIFIYNTAAGPRVRTSPQLLSTGPGHVEWTVVNLTSDEPVDVEITWQADSPWGGKEPILIKNGNCRKSMDGARDGRYKYNVTANGYTEDPELEYPEN